MEEETRDILKYLVHLRGKDQGLHVLRAVTREEESYSGHSNASLQLTDGTSTNKPAIS